MYNHHLDTFLRAADLGSFSRAAEELYISPNAVMKQINLLESHLDLQLFIRDNHGLKLTPAGEVVYREAKAIIRRSNKALALARAASAPKSLIRVGTSLMRPGQRVIELWQEVSAQCPDIRLQLVSFDDRTREYSEVVRRLGRDIDILFGLVPSDRFNASCSILPLGSYPVCCAMPRSHPLAQRKSLTIQDLHGEQLMMVYRGNSAYIDAVRDDLTRNHPQVEIVDTPDYDMDVLHKCETSGCLMITAEIWKDIHPSLVTVPVEWDYSVPYGLFYSKHPTEAVEQFVKAVKAARNIP